LLELLDLRSGPKTVAVLNSSLLSKFTYIVIKTKRVQWTPKLCHMNQRKDIANNSYVINFLYKQRKASHSKSISSQIWQRNCETSEIKMNIDVLQRSILYHQVTAAVI